MLSGRFEGSSKIARNLSATSRFLLAMPCLDRRKTVGHTKFDNYERWRRIPNIPNRKRRVTWQLLDQRKIMDLIHGG